MNNEGNFYNESIAWSNIGAGDCGPANITYPYTGEFFSTGTPIKINWTRQSSQKAINYYLYYSNNSVSWTYLTSTPNLEYLWDTTSISNSNYTIKLIPYDNLYNATINISKNFSIQSNIPPSISSVLLNATSSFNRTQDNLTAYPIGVSDPNGDNIEINYNWYKDGISDNLLNMPFTAPDNDNLTYDFSGFDNHGVVVNATWNATSGYDGFGAFEFDGDFDSINTSLLMSGSSITYGAWVKFTSLDCSGGWCDIIRMINTSYYGYELGSYYDGSDHIFDCYDDDNDVVSSTTISADTWYHVMCWHNQTDTCIFVDGVRENCDASNANASGDGNLVIGASIFDEDFWFNGTIDEVRVWNRSLSDDEIAMFYSNHNNETHYSATNIGDNWSVKATPIDEYGQNGTGVFSNEIFINPPNYPPLISSVVLNTTSASNMTTDNLTANPVGISDLDGDPVEVNYNWYINGMSDTVLNMPFTRPDSLNQTYDFSGNDKHGTINSARWNNTGGHNGTGAYEFSDTISSIQIPSVMSGNSFSYGAWVKMDGTSSCIDAGAGPVCTLIVQGNVGGHGSGMITGNSNLVFCYSLDDSALSGGYFAPAGEWHHYMCVHNSTDLAMFVDGHLQGSWASSTASATSDDLIIGAWNGIYYFNGTVDDVIAYNRELSTEEINLIYQNKTDTIHYSTITAGENWTVKATPIDSYGENGTGVFSNSINITEMSIDFISQTKNESGIELVVNETEYILPDQNLTIKLNISNIGGSISSVWIKVWETVQSAGNVIWEGLMSLVGGLWQAEVPVNGSYPTYVNYTVFVNDTVNTTYEIDGNFSVNHPPNITSLFLNTTSPKNFSTENLTAYVTGINDADNEAVKLYYNWYRNSMSDTLLNMPFTKPDSSNRTYDLSGYDNHGNVTNATWNATGGYDGFGAFEFDGANDFIDLPDYGNLYNVTVAFWAKTADPDPDVFLIPFNFKTGFYSSGLYTIAFVYTSDVYQVYYATLEGSSTICNSITSIRDGKWHFIVAKLFENVTNNKVQPEIYLDGNLDSVCAGLTGSMKETRLHQIGLNYPTPDYFNGTMDDIRIYNRSLSAEEIWLLYNNRTNMTPSSVTSAGDNWSVKVTPIDARGLNGSSYLSNGVVVKENNNYVCSDETQCEYQDITSALFGEN
ncbi:MAG: LamG domain-containing protein, partial [Nanoarchaeota archaeon]|nr:LamG domain-containing protein [Nanoarchaeota archaeon]